MGTFPAGWTPAASSFNWTLDIVRARRSAQDITAAIPSAVGVHVIELEAGRCFGPSRRRSLMKCLRYGTRWGQAVGG
jgi:hypothetical protein